MPEPIRLIAMDMDGTLLAGDARQIPPENARALRVAAARGIRLALCSGRLPDDAGFFALDAGLEMAVLALNGGCVLDRPLGPIRQSRRIEPAAMARLKRLLDDAEVLYGLFSDNALAVSLAASRQKPELLWGAYILREGSRGEIAYGGEATAALLPRGVNKLVVIDEADTGILGRLRLTIAREIPQVEVTSSWSNNLEINPSGVNKGAALTELAAEMNIPMSQVMALGDNDNDIPMLRCAGYGVAMGNSSAGALDAAGYVTLTNERHGVAAAVRALALGEAVPGVRALR